jgi:hypothetical protein
VNLQGPAPGNDVAFGPGVYVLWAEAKVAGGRVVVQQTVDAQMYDADPQMREAARKSVRWALVEAILDRWKPVIRIRGG